MKKIYGNRFGVILTAATIALVAGAQGLRAQDRMGTVADIDGIKQPHIGVADSRTPSSTPAAPDAVAPSQSATQPPETDGAEPPDCATGFDLDKAYKGYLKRKRNLMDVVARADGDK
jgi:hypothetical protein